MVAYLLSTCNNTSMINTGLKDKSRNTNFKPTIPKSYNRKKGSVSNQQLNGLHKPI